MNSEKVNENQQKRNLNWMIKGESKRKKNEEWKTNCNKKKSG